MAKNQCNPEEIVDKLSKAEVLHGRGMWIAKAIGQLGVSERTFYQGDQRQQADHGS